MQSQVLQYANDYLADGIHVLPLRNGAKIPAAAWKHHQTRPQAPDDLPKLFTSESYNVGVLGGSISDNLLILDHDDPEKTEQLRSSPLFNHLLTMAPVVKTRRGFHLWVKVPELVKSSKCGRLGVDVLSEGKYAVAPPSEVRKEHYKNQLYLFTGEKMLPVYRIDQEQFTELKILYDLKNPGETAPVRATATATEWEAADSTEWEAADCQDETFYGLGRTFWRNIKNPAAIGSRSEQEAGLVVRSAALGWTAAEIHYLFTRHSAPGSKFQEKQKNGYDRQYIDTLYRSALEYIKSHQSPEMKTVNELITLLVNINPFTGRGAATERAVMTVLLDYSRQAGTFNISPGYRAIAERAGVDTMRVSRAIDRLQSKNFIVTEKAEGEKVIIKPGNLELIKRETLHITTKSSFPVGSYTSQISRGEFSHDVFRSRALGKDGKKVIEFLNASPLPWTRKTFPGTFKYCDRVLPVLIRAGFIRQVTTAGQRTTAGRPKIFYQTLKKVTSSEYAELAAAFGTLGMLEEQKRRNATDRAAWAKKQQSKE